MTPRPSNNSLSAEERALKLAKKWGDGAPGSKRYVETVEAIKQAEKSVFERTFEKAIQICGGRTDPNGYVQALKKIRLEDL